VVLEKRRAMMIVWTLKVEFGTQVDLVIANTLPVFRVKRSEVKVTRYS